MTETGTIKSATSLSAASGGSRYDAVTIVLHWLTALLVLALFALAQLWDFAPRDSALKHTMQSLHVSLGVSLAAVLAARLVWRVLYGRHLPRSGSPLMARAARAMHLSLYVLLVTMVAAGFGKIWSRGRAAGFFDLFSLPPAFAIDPGWRPIVDTVHEWGAWTIIVLAACHAGAALYHHYALRDGTLRRMLAGAPRS